MSDLFQSPGDATPLDEEEKQALKLGVSTRAELNEAERANILAARLWAMRGATLRRSDLLSDAFVRELHRRMFSEVWRWAGVFRRSEKNLGWEVHRLAEGVHSALADAAVQLAHQTYPVAEVAVRLHHRMVVIHPWSNGNGRHARLLADVLVAARREPELTWGGVADLAQMSRVRRRYLDALRDADRGDFAALLVFARGETPAPAG